MLPANRAPESRLLRELPLLWSEARRRGGTMLLASAVIAALALAVGLVWPRKYESSTTILVTENNIIQPLMEGRAATTSISDRARIANEVILSRKVMNEIMRDGGWLANDPSALEQERMIEEIARRTTVSSAGPNLIEIRYEDHRPERALLVTRRYAELFISESLDAKKRESREAFEFIAARADEYHKKLIAAEERLKRFRAQNPDARPGSAVDVNTRVAELRSRIEQARTEASEMQMRASALSGQLSGEAAVAGVLTREGQYRARLSDLHQQLDKLLLDYTDEYPDVVRIRHQIADAEAEMAREAARREKSGGDSTLTNSVVNPVYAQLRGEIGMARGSSAALQARVAQSEALLQEELERGRRVADTEAALAELTRDYEVNRELHQDLLKRRENARVSMNIDEERRGLTFRIQEPAALPLEPNGLRLLHFAAAGLVLGLVLPAGALAGFLRVDPRARSASALALQLPVPLMVSVPEYLHGDALAQRRRRLRMGLFAVAAALVAYALVAAWRIAVSP